MSCGRNLLIIHITKRKSKKKKIPSNHPHYQKKRKERKKKEEKEKGKKKKGRKKKGSGRGGNYKRRE